MRCEADRTAEVYLFRWLMGMTGVAMISHLFRPRFEQQVFLKLDVDGSRRTADRSQILAVHVVGNVIDAIGGKTTQSNLPFPLSREECVIQVAILADGVRLRPVKADVVERSQVLSAREHLLLVNP